jgi:carbohydrate kinase (thermoresistant glucokinase family)
MVIVVMGVSGSGKTTVASELARRLGWPFAEADLFHSPQNVAKMRAGTPLDDADRWPWLHAIARWIDERIAAGENGVVTCSALKRAYREILAGTRSEVRIVYLQGRVGLIASRMALRVDHYMPVALLESQFQALEEPTPQEGVLVLPIEADPAHIVDRIIATLRLAPRPQ